MKKWIVMLLSCGLMFGCASCDKEDLYKTQQKVEDVVDDVGYQVHDPDSDVQQAVEDLQGLIVTAVPLAQLLSKTFSWATPVVGVLNGVLGILTVFLGLRLKTTRKTLTAVVGAVEENKKFPVIVGEYDTATNKTKEIKSTIGDVLKPQVAANLQGLGINREGGELIKDAKNI